jgi:hypothetical protein
VDTLRAVEDVAGEPKDRAREDGSEEMTDPILSAAFLPLRREEGLHLGILYVLPLSLFRCFNAATDLH